ncbi:carboxypeptidase-like regulatory domain-containing protein [candidate division KSB1 bacterium]|nr:carboxypeptidase-like regulatory domain-containing protein [candidate division KSB1 bacterium]
MIKKVSFSKRTIILSLFIFVFLATSILMAGTTGKISGRVFDQSTGEPLPGANVKITGTMMGASTDASGFYFIINVPPGTYSVKVLFMGYEGMIKSNVQVMVDRTTNLDFALSTEVIAGEAVTIVAERPIVERDVTGSMAVMNSEKLERSPVIDLKDAIRQQSGIYSTGETTYMRAGLASEINYRLDGTSMNSGVLSDNWQRLNTTAVQELSVLTGGYNAEYGNAMSGVVNVVTKEADISQRNHHGIVKYRLRPAGQYHWGDNIYSDDLWKYTNYDLAFWQEQLQDASIAASYAQYFERFYNGDGTTPTAEQLLSKYREQITPDEVLGDYANRHEHDVEATFYGSPMDKMSYLVSGRFKNAVNIWPQAEKYNPEYNIQAKFNYYLSSDKKLSLNLLRGYYKSCTYTESNWNNMESSQEARWQPNSDVHGPYDGQAYAPWGGYWLKGPQEKALNMATLKWQHTLSPATFYTVQFSYLSDDMTELQDYSKLETDLSTVGWGDSWFDLGGNFRLEARQIQVNNYSKSKVFTAKSDLTSQINKTNQVKTGVEFKLYDIDYQHYYMEFPAGDVWHLDNVFKGKPVESAFYIQDKMEFSGMVVNVGLRFDAFNAQHKYPESIYDPLGFQTWNGGDGINPSNTEPIWQADMDAKDWFATDIDYQSYFAGVRKDKSTVDSDWKFAFAPRIGMAFPITANSKLRFTYGHFNQRPSWSKIMGFPTSWYDSNPLGSVRMDQWQGWYGQPGLTYEKTIQYELGFDQNLFDFIRLGITAYYKDASRLTRFSHLGTYNQSGGGFSSTGWGAGNVETFSTARNIANDGHDNIFYTNNSFKDIRGIEVNAEKLFNDRWAATFMFNYGLSTGGRAGYWQYREDADAVHQPHSFSEDKVTWISSYILKGSINYVTPSNLGPLGMLGDISVSLFHEYFAGPEYTWYPKDYTGLQTPNNKRWYPHNRTDLKFVKRIPLGSITPIIGVEVFNLFNNYDRLLPGGTDLDNWEQEKEKPKHWRSGEEDIWSFYNSISNPNRMIYFTLSLEF